MLNRFIDKFMLIEIFKATILYLCYLRKLAAHKKVLDIFVTCARQLRSTMGMR